MNHKLLKAFTKQISGTISNGFSAIETQLDRDLKIKEHNNRQLMDFQETLNSYNSELHKCIMILYQLKKFKKDKYMNKLYHNHNEIKRNETIFNIKCIKTNLISYISLWSISYTHGIIS